MVKMVLPGQGGQQGIRKNLRNLKVPQNPSIKNPGQFDMEFSSQSFRENDMKLPLKSGQMPRKMDAKVIMNTIDQVYQPPQGKITDYIKKFDSENTSGAIKPHLDVLDKLLKKGSQSLASMSGMLGGGLMQQVQKSVDEQDPGRKCPVGQRWDEDKKRCVPDCPRGQKWDVNLKRCVPEEEDDQESKEQLISGLDPSTGLPDMLLG
jgi:hypothetical protein